MNLLKQGSFFFLDNILCTHKIKLKANFKASRPINGRFIITMKGLLLLFMVAT
jgi:hypothetical protein